MTYEENTPAPQKTQQSLSTLTEHKALNALEAEKALNQAIDNEMLSEQAQILNQLFGNILNDHVQLTLNNKRHYRHDAKTWLAFALKIQHQCTQAIRTKNAIDYMQSLELLGTETEAGTPLPLNFEKQKEGS